MGQVFQALVAPQLCGRPALLCWKLFRSFPVTIPLGRAWAICISLSPQGTAEIWAGTEKGWDTVLREGQPEEEGS